MIVVDTNVISYFLIPNERYNELAAELLEKDRYWIAPSLWKYEFLNVLSLYQRQALINKAECSILYRKSFELLETKNVNNIDHIFKVMENNRLSGYDSVFVALASETNLPLITEDRNILKEFPNLAFSMRAYLK